MSKVDLSKNTPENINYMVNQITLKLKMANAEALRSESMNADLYDELREIYEMVMRKDNFSINEMQALAEELGQLRKV